jgi:hypothetical protein
MIGGPPGCHPVGDYLVPHPVRPDRPLRSACTATNTLARHAGARAPQSPLSDGRHDAAAAQPPAVPQTHRVVVVLAGVHEHRRWRALVLPGDHQPGAHDARPAEMAICLATVIAITANAGS